MKIKFISLFLIVFFLLGCSNTESSNSSSSLNNSIEHERQDLIEMLNKLDGVNNYELSDDMKYLTLYVSSNMVTASSSEKREFLNALAEALNTSLKLTGYYDNIITIVVKDFSNGKDLYSYLNGVIVMY